MTPEQVEIEKLCKVCRQALLVNGVVYKHIGCWCLHKDELGNPIPPVVYFPLPKDFKEDFYSSSQDGRKG